MNKRILWVLALGSGLGSAGCLQPVSVERQKAHERWGSMRNDVLCELATNALAAGDLSKARTQLQKVLSERPEHEWARTKLATVAIREEKLTEAARLLHDVADWDEPTVEALNLRGVLDEMSQDYESAAKHYALAWQMDRGRTALATAAIEAYLAAGDVATARGLYAEVETDMPVTAGMYLVKAEIERADGDKEAAAKLYRRAMSLAELHGERDERWIAMSLADLYREMGRATDGAKLVRGLWEDVSFEERDLAGWALAKCLASVGKTNEAIAIVDEVCSQRDTRVLLIRMGTDDDNGRKLSGRGSSYRSDGEAGDCDVMQGEVWYLASRHFAMAENWDRAWSAIERAGAATSTRGDLLMLEAVVASKLGKSDRARLAIRRWEQVQPDDPMIAVVREGVGAGM